MAASTAEIECLPKPTGSNYDFVIIGDSHASAMSEPLLNAAAKRGQSGLQITISDCAPFTGFNSGAAACDAANRKLLTFLRGAGIPTAVVAVRYTSLTNSHGFDNGQGGVEAEKDWSIIFLGGDMNDRIANAKKTITAGVSELQNIHQNVILVYPVPEAGWHVPRRLAKQLYFKGVATDLSTRVSRYLDRNQSAIGILDGLDDERLQRVRPDGYLCNTMIPDRCVNSFAGQVFYYDSHHLSNTGAALLVPDILDHLGRAE